MTTFEQLKPDQQRVALALLELKRQEGIKFRAKYEAENVVTGKKFEGIGTFILPASLETDETYEYRSGKCYYIIPKEEIQWVESI
jgi:hypothetical protein